MTEKSNIVRLKPRSKTAEWERSFPAGSISGCTWIIDVLDDLIAFCEANHLKDLAIDLSESRNRIEKALRRSKL